MQYKVPIFFDFFICCPSPTWFRWRESGRRAESDSGGDGLLANPRSRPTPPSVLRTPTSESVGWLLLLFATEKQRKKVFLNFTLKVREASGRSQFSQTFFFLYFWGQKYQKPPHVVFRGSARAAALHGARKIKPMRHPVTGAPQPAPSFSASNESAELLCRHGRHRVKYQFTQTDRFCLFFRKFDSLFSARWGPTWFRWRKSVRKAESDSGGDGLLANPRIVARRRFQTSGRRHRNRSGGFCCFSTPKSREKSFPEFYAESSRGFRKIAVFTNFFFLYFWGQKYQKPPHDVFRGIARAAALHGARKIKPMRHPVTSAPQPAPSFSASNESADLLCRRWRQRI